MLVCTCYVQGAELLDQSSLLLHQGEVVKGAGGSWPKEVTLFLFDRQLVYCKKDIIKRNTFVYRGRINLDQCSVEDIPENKGRDLWKRSSLCNLKINFVVSIYAVLYVNCQPFLTIHCFT